MELHRNDTVIILSGKDKGKQGTIEKVMQKSQQVVVTGLNIMKKHAKPSNKYPSGGIVEIAYPLHQSKVKIVEGSEVKTPGKTTAKKKKSS